MLELQVGEKRTATTVRDVTLGLKFFFELRPSIAPTGSLGMVFKD